MKNRTLNTSIGIALLALFVLLFIKLTEVQEGTNFSGFVLGGASMIGLILGCLIIAGIIKLIFKKASFLTVFLMVTLLSIFVFHIQLYFPF